MMRTRSDDAWRAGAKHSEAAQSRLSAALTASAPASLELTDMAALRLMARRQAAVTPRSSRLSVIAALEYVGPVGTVR